MPKNKSAQIGSTITWFPAFIIIFFIMVLFVGASGILAAQKVAKADSISLSGTSDNSQLMLEKELDFVLDSLVNGKTIKQEIIERTLKGDFKDRVFEIFGKGDLQKDINSLFEKSEIKNRNLFFNYYDAEGTIIGTFKLRETNEELNNIEISKTIFLGENKIVIGYVQEGK